MQYILTQEELDELQAQEAIVKDTLTELLLQRDTQVRRVQDGPMMEGFIIIKVPVDLMESRHIDLAVQKSRQ